MIESCNVRSSVERAIALYLKSVDFGGLNAANLGGAFLGEPSETTRPLAVHVMAGEIDEEGELPEEWEQLTLPALVVQCPSSDPHPIGYDICEVSLLMMTTPQEQRAPDRTRVRTAWLTSIFDEQFLPTLATALSATIDGLTVIGIERVGDSHQENGRHIIGVARLRVHATVTG